MKGRFSPYMEAENMNQEPLSPQEKGSIHPKSTVVSDILDYLEIFVLAICVVIVIFSFSGFRLCTVSGPSMENTLFHGERLITSGYLTEPKRNDIIVFHQTSDMGGFNEPIVKRVIAVAGDTVHINYQTWTVTVTDAEGNVQILEEPYRKLEGSNPYSPLPITVYVEEGTVFVMGDNRNHSADSRDGRIGLVDTRRILGKVVFRITPFSRFGTVN